MIDPEEIIAATGDRFTHISHRLNIAIRQIVAKFNDEIARIEAEISRIDPVELQRRLERIEDDYQRKPSEGYRFTVEEG